MACCSPQSEVMVRLFSSKWIISCRTTWRHSRSLSGRPAHPSNGRTRRIDRASQLWQSVAIPEARRDEAKAARRDHPLPENMTVPAPTREERLLMALEHARVHARLKGEDHFVELRKHMGWYLGHFPGAKRVRNELVRINSLADVERIIQAALDQPEAFSDEEQGLPVEDLHDPELDLSCIC